MTIIQTFLFETDFYEQIRNKLSFWKKPKNSLFWANTFKKPQKKPQKTK